MMDGKTAPQPDRPVRGAASSPEGTMRSTMALSSLISDLNWLASHYHQDAPQAVVIQRAIVQLAQWHSAIVSMEMEAQINGRAVQDYTRRMRAHARDLMTTLTDPTVRRREAIMRDEWLAFSGRVAALRRPAAAHPDEVSGDGAAPAADKSPDEVSGDVAVATADESEAILRILRKMKAPAAAQPDPRLRVE